MCTVLIYDPASLVISLKRIISGLSKTKRGQASLLVVDLGPDYGCEKPLDANGLEKLAVTFHVDQSRTSEANDELVGPIPSA